jgi:hypothetical protein
MGRLVSVRFDFIGFIFTKGIVDTMISKSKYKALLFCKVDFAKVPTIIEGVKLSQDLLNNKI